MTPLSPLLELHLERCAGNGQIGAIYADSSHIHPIQGIVICQDRGVHVCTIGLEFGLPEQRGGNKSCDRLVGNETSRKHIQGTGLSDVAGLGIGFRGLLCGPCMCYDQF